MKKFLHTFLISLTLGSLFIPMTAMGAGLDNICQSKITKVTKDDLCLSEDDKKTKVYTVLEESLDTPDTQANGNNTTIRKCFRYTEILQCIPEGATKKQKQVNQQLLKKCPDDIPNTGTDINNQYFDCQEVAVIVSDVAAGGTGILQVYVSLIYRWAAGIVGVIAVLMIVVSGVQITMADGEPSKVDEAKTRIFQSLGGIALLFLASALLYVINPTFFQKPNQSAAPAPTSTIQNSDVDKGSIQQNMDQQKLPSDPGMTPDNQNA